VPRDYSEVVREIGSPPWALPEVETVTPIETHEAICQVIPRHQSVGQMIEEMRREMPQCFI
jgi:hypothetical protein